MRMIELTEILCVQISNIFITDTNGCAESSRACQNATKLCKYNLFDIEIAFIDFLKVLLKLI